MNNDQKIECDIRLDILESLADISQFDHRDVFTAGFEAALDYMERGI